MNRTERRRTAGQSRHRVGYLHRIMTARRVLERGRAYHVEVAHDADCEIYGEAFAPADLCTCVPDITITPLDGGPIITVGVDGRCKRSASA